MHPTPSPLRVSPDASIGDQVLSLTAGAPPPRAHLAGTPPPSDNLALAVRLLAGRLDEQAERIRQLETWKADHLAAHSPWGWVFWWMAWTRVVEGVRKAYYHFLIRRDG